MSPEEAQCQFTREPAEPGEDQLGSHVILARRRQVIGDQFIAPGLGRDVRLLVWYRMLLLLRRQEAWPNKRPRPMPEGPGEKDVVLELLAHDSSHGPAEAGHVFAIEEAY